MIKEKIGRIKDRFVNGGDIVTTFLRSSVSSQIASWIDMGVGFVFFAFVHLMPWISTAIGAVCGGIVNCIINYRFTFHATSLPVKAVAVKYAMVWLGSLLLNVYGTQLGYELLDSLSFLKEWGFRPNGYYAASRLSVSLIVSIFWNFLMQKNFVYQATRFDPYAIRFVDLFVHPKRSLHTGRSAGADHSHYEDEEEHQSTSGEN